MSPLGFCVGVVTGGRRPLELAQLLGYEWENRRRRVRVRKTCLAFPRNRLGGQTDLGRFTSLSGDGLQTATPAGWPGPLERSRLSTSGNTIGTGSR